MVYELSLGGGIGRRVGLKIQFSQESEGSIPSPGTILHSTGVTDGRLRLRLKRSVNQNLSLLFSEHSEDGDDRSFQSEAGPTTNT